MATKTLRAGIADNDQKFLFSLAKEESKDVSKKVRQLVEPGRVMLAINKYKKSEASIEKAARIAEVSISEMMDILSEYGVDSNIEYEDYLKGLKSLKKIWQEFDNGLYHQIKSENVKEVAETCSGNLQVSNIEWKAEAMTHKWKAKAFRYRPSATGI